MSLSERCIKAFPTLVVAFAFITAVDGIAYYLGEDINWDLLNYHFYNGYAYTHGVMLKDSLGTIQSYLDPFLNSFYYLLIINFSPLVVNLVIASMQSLSIIFVFILSMNVFNEISFNKRFIMSTMIASSAIFGPVFWSEIGGTMGDTLLSSGVILSLLFIVKMIQSVGHFRKQIFFIFLAGIPVGLVSGMKFTNMVYAVGIFIALSLVVVIDNHLNFKIKILFLGLFILSSSLGLVVIYGPIGWELWRHYGNPVFPYYNNIFKSPYISSVPISDSRWFPRSFLGYLEMPFRFCTIQSLSNNRLFGLEIPFKICFFAIIAVLIPLSILVNIARSSINIDTNRLVIIFMTMFMLVSFIVWEVFFSYYRYIAALEIISPLVTAILISSFFKNAMKYTSLFGIIILSISLYSIPDSNWGRKSFTSSYFGLNNTSFSKVKNSLIVVGYVPIGFVLPYFPKSDHFISASPSMAMTPKFSRIYYKTLSHWHHQVYFLGRYDSNLRSAKQHVSNISQKYKIYLQTNTCHTFPTRIFPIVLCQMSRVK